LVIWYKGEKKAYIRVFENEISGVQVLETKKGEVTRFRKLHNVDEI
jgi:hypothetical protein